MIDLFKAIAYGSVFAVLFLPLIVSDTMFFPFITGKNFWFRILVEVGLAAWILLAVYDVRYRPRFSWLLPSVGGLLVVMFFANLLGVHPQSSFWSNYERMDGYVTLVHFALYFLTLGSLLSHKEIDLFGYKTSTWQVFFSTALFASVCVSFTAFRQLSGLAEITMGTRMNGTLGNAAYMAVYMLFSTFVAVWIAAHTRSRLVQAGCAVLTAVFIFLLFQTATRGTMIGLMGGVFLGALYIAIFNTQYPRVRQLAIAAIVAVVLAVSGLVAFKDSSFVQGNNILKRATAVNATELSLRFDIWTIALEGAQERPLLGYGQSNFNYVFNEYYRPDFSYRAEQWYDRAHNVIMDWLIAGGVLGLVTYLSIFFIALYYMIIAPLRKESPFTVTERGLIIGIGSAYFIHNLVVFDNLVSYIFFAILLALVHSRVSTPVVRMEKASITPAIATQVVTPIVVTIAVLVIYFVNVPGMAVARDIIVAFRSPDPAAKEEVFEKAFDRGSFAQQELTEQMAQQALGMLGNPQFAPEAVQRFVTTTEGRLQALAEAKPGDARVHVFLASFYRGIGQFDLAREQIALARSFSPTKPHIILEQALVEYQAGDVQAMNAYMKESYELAPANADAQVFYGISLLLTGASSSEVLDVVATTTWERFATNNLALQSADRGGVYDLAKMMLETRIAVTPASPQNLFGLSSVQYRGGDTEAAIATLEEAIVAFPETTAFGNCYIENLKSGNEPEEGCGQ